MSSLWRGTLTTRLRIVSGLVLFTYVLFHFLNIGLGLFSSELMQQAQGWRQVVTRSLPGEFLLYAALLTHLGLAMWQISARRTWRMPIWEAVQILLGLTIPLMLISHITYTRVAHEIFGVNDQFAYLIGLIFGSATAWLQALLLLVVWVHGCTGLHFWLRGQTWWRGALPYLIGFAALVPGFALAGFLTEGRRVAALMSNQTTLFELFEKTNWPDAEQSAVLTRIDSLTTAVFWGLLALIALIFLARKLVLRRMSVKVRYVNGPEITSSKGPTLLEMSRANGVPHTSLCGGRGRCTTCRVVIEEGSDLLHPPSDAEMLSLKAVGAAPGTRLACQIRPTAPLTVYRVFRPDGRRDRAHSSQGQERRMALLFLDIRGFTARTTGQLPYDVVFLLNRFFDAIVPAITRYGGVVDKYLGDGLLALFETADEATSARAAIEATTSIGAALESFNQMLTAEGAPELRIGIGVHLGNVVLGEIGAAGNAPRTIIGETVNATSRLEAMTKDLGIEALVSADVLRSARIDSQGFELITLDLRGVRTPLSALAVARASELSATLTPIAESQ